MTDTQRTEKNPCGLVKEHLVKILANLFFWFLGAGVYFVFFKFGWWNDSTNVLSSINTFLTSVLDVGVFLVLLVWSTIALIILLFFKAKSLFMEILSELTRFFYIAGTFIFTMVVAYNTTHTSIIVPIPWAALAFAISAITGFAIFWVGKIAIEWKCK